MNGLLFSCGKSICVRQVSDESEMGQLVCRMPGVVTGKVDLSAGLSCTSYPAGTHSSPIARESDRRNGGIPAGVIDSFDSLSAGFGLRDGMPANPSFAVRAQFCIDCLRVVESLDTCYPGCIVDHDSHTQMDKCGINNLDAW